MADRTVKCRLQDAGDQRRTSLLAVRGWSSRSDISANEKRDKPIRACRACFQDA
jgi:hypothetical protein